MTECTTRAGIKLQIRPVASGDEPVLRDLFGHVSRDDLRFRFLTGMKTVPDDQIKAMVNVDHNQTEDFIAFAEDGKTPLAAAMLACDELREKGEVAISVRADHKNKGIGWTLLAQVARYAKAQGVKSIESIESRANSEALSVERDLGFAVKECPGDATLVVVSKQL